MDCGLVDAESGRCKKLPCGQILQKIQKQSKRKTRNDSEEGSLPTYTDYFPSSDDIQIPEESFYRYPPIQEEPDSFDGSEIDNTKQNKY